MARFERSKPRKRSKEPKGSSEKLDARSTKSFKEHTKERSSRRGSGRGSRDSKRGSRNRRDFQMTKVTCSSCGESCEVPFKPTTSKPVYCDNCFAKTDKRGSSSKGLEKINEKLDKIMAALEIK